MIITKKHLSRRTFLRGTLGATVALPFLDAMIPAFSAQSKARPFRFGAVYLPNGVYPQRGIRIRSAATSSSSRSCSRSNRSATTWSPSAR